MHHFPRIPFAPYTFPMGLKDVDVGQAMRLLAERRIEEAMREGKFDNLAGAGKELNLEPMPADENARLTWWCLRIMKSNDFTPDEVRWRKAVEALKDSLDTITTEPRLRAAVAQVNDLVHKINTLGTNAINIPLAPLVLDHELARFRSRTSGRAYPSDTGF